MTESERSVAIGPAAPVVHTNGHVSPPTAITLADSPRTQVQEEETTVLPAAAPAPRAGRRGARGRRGGRGGRAARAPRRQLRQRSRAGAAVRPTRCATSPRTSPRPTRPRTVTALREAADPRRAARAAERGRARAHARGAGVPLAVPRAGHAELRARRPRGAGRQAPAARAAATASSARTASRSRAGSCSAWSATAASRGSG